MLTSGGALGAGWKLNFYTGGTSTAITTYNARTSGSANANPVVADASGRFDEIWIEDAQTIKYVLTDENGTTKVTVDDYLISDEPPTIDTDLEDFLAGDAALPIANGGTASTSAANALTALGALPAAGGTVSGNIIRSSAGGHLYHTTAAMTSGRVFLTEDSESDPTSVAGDIWLKYTA